MKRRDGRASLSCWLPTFWAFEVVLLHALWRVQRSAFSWEERKKHQKNKFHRSEENFFSRFEKRSLPSWWHQKQSWQHTLLALVVAATHCRLHAAKQHRNVRLLCLFVLIFYCFKTPPYNVKFDRLSVDRVLLGNLKQNYLKEKSMKKFLTPYLRIQEARATASTEAHTAEWGWICRTMRRQEQPMCPAWSARALCRRRGEICIFLSLFLSFFGGFKIATTNFAGGGEDTSLRN